VRATLAHERAGAQRRPARRVGDCVQDALLCRGVLDAAVDPLVKPWEIGALPPCVLEAGGSVSDLNGETTRIVERRPFVAASSAALRRASCAQVGTPV
jgi:histidinol-phosphatase